MPEEPYSERDTESGQFTPTYTEEDFLEALRSLENGAATQDVADEVGCAYRTAHAKLSELEEEGIVTSRKVGSALLWTLAEGDGE